MRIFYFGCHGGAGHFFWDVGMRHSREGEYVQPWGNEVDGWLCPGSVPGVPYKRTRPEVEGEALLHHKRGWTALSFWDRSVDRRGGCNSNFIAEGTHTFEEMVTLAQKHFPEVWRRFKFEVRLADPVVERQAA